MVPSAPGSGGPWASTPMGATPPGSRPWLELSPSPQKGRRVLPGHGELWRSNKPFVPVGLAYGEAFLGTLLPTMPGPLARRGFGSRELLRVQSALAGDQVLPVRTSDLKRPLLRFACSPRLTIPQQRDRTPEPSGSSFQLLDPDPPKSSSWARPRMPPRGSPSQPYALPIPLSRADPTPRCQRIRQGAGPIRVGV